MVKRSLEADYMFLARTHTNASNNNRTVQNDITTFFELLTVMRSYILYTTGMNLMSSKVIPSIKKKTCQ